jgi:DNA-binding NarL/FixJ family response regulator
MKTILVIDDHPLVIDGIKTMLQDVKEFQICGFCKTGGEAMSFLKNAEPDMILLDISLPDTNGLQLCEQIRGQYKDISILGLTSTNEAGIIAGFLQKGGNGYLLKNMEREELLEALETISEGRTYLCKAANEKILESFHNIKNAVNSVPILTRREKEIIELLADGLSGPQIAEKLFLSHHTVDTHRKNLLKKFNVNNVQMLLKIGRQYKLVE